jgi:hypothetical protein
VRITHRYDPQLDLFTVDLEPIAVLSRVGLEWDTCRLELRHAHLNRHQAVRFDTSAGNASTVFQHRLIGAAILRDQARNASGAIAALLSFAAIAIKDAISDVRCRVSRRFQPQELIKTDTSAAIRKPPNALPAERLEPGPHYDYEIVTESLHFCEGQLHGGARLDFC